MNNPIIRLAKSTPAVHLVFLTAGLTIFSVTVLQSVVIVASWAAAID